jgi:uncharacterized protein YxjI
VTAASSGSGGEALLGSPAVVVDQSSDLLSDDVLLLAPDGRHVGRGRTRGSVAARMFLGSRSIVVQGDGGAPVVRVDAVLRWGRRRFRLRAADGRVLGRCVVHARRDGLGLEGEVQGEALTARGDLAGREYVLALDGRTLATASGSWPGVPAALLSRPRYVIGFGPDAGPDDRRLALGVAVAVDLVRADRPQAA